MSIKRMTYNEARKMMQPGDVIAFGGKGNFSEIIKLATSSTVSHVGVILQTKVIEEDSDRFFNQIIESTSLNGFNGVTISRFSDRLDSYDGELWWLPLNRRIREKAFNSVKFFNFLFRQAKERKEYDVAQAVYSAIDALDKLTFGVFGRGPTSNREDFEKFFCSELVAAGLKAAGMTGNINASEVTPIDLCRWEIYENDYYQLKGSATKKISRFNSIPPAYWSGA